VRFAITQNWFTCPLKGVDRTTAVPQNSEIILRNMKLNVKMDIKTQTNYSECLLRLVVLHSRAALSGILLAILTLCR